MSPREWGPHFLRTTRGRLVARLRSAPATVDQLAKIVRLTPNGVRAHLVGLERDGWVRSAGVRRSDGAGKPATLYQLAPGAEALLSTAYRPLLLALLQVLQQRLDQRELDRLLRAVGRRLAAGVRGERRALDLPAAVTVLEGLGASVEVEERGRGRVTLAGHGCPIGDVVAAEPHGCQALAAFLAALLDREVRSACEHGERPRCRFAVGGA